MVLQGGVSFNETIQQKINDHINDLDLKRFVIVLNNESGSFSLPENVRLTLRNCNGVTCSGNDGNNELSLVNCNGVTIKDFKNGVLRLENCDGISLVNCSDSVKFVISDTTLGALTFKNSEVTILSCTVPKLTVTDCKLVSLKNTLNSITATGGSIHSENDNFAGSANFSGGVRGTIISPNGSGSVTVKDSSITIQNSNLQTITAKSGLLIANKGQIQDIELTGSGDGLKAIINGVQVQTINSQQAEVDLTDPSGNGQYTFQQSTLNGVNVNADQLTMTDCSAVLVAANIQGTCQFSSSSVNISGSQLQQITVSDGAIQSANNQFQSSLEITGATVDSYNDQVTGTCVMTGLIGPSVVRNLQSSGTCTISGNGSSSLLFEKNQGTTLSALNFGKLELYNNDFTECLVSNTALLFAIGNNFPSTQLTSVFTAITQQLLNLIAINSTLIDTSSVITQCTSCTVIGAGTRVVNAIDSFIQAAGGTVVATGASLVISQGAPVVNPAGLTLGVNFPIDAVLGPLVQSDGIALNVQSMMDTNVTAVTGVVQVTSLAGAVNVTATGPVAVESGEIDLTSATVVTITSPQVVING